MDTGYALLLSEIGIRLNINTLVAMRQCTPKTRHAEGRGTLRARDIGIHAFVQHADPRVHLGRIQAALPLGRGVTPVGGLEREQIGGVARAGAPDR